MNYVPSAMYERPTPTFPYSLNDNSVNTEPSRTLVEWQNDMETFRSGSFQRQGPYYMADAYAEISVEDSEAAEIPSSKPFFVISSSYTSSDNNYFGADGKYILYEESEQYISFSQITHTKPGSNQDSFYINVYLDSNTIKLFNRRTNNAVGTWYHCNWKMVSNTKNNTGNGDDTGNYCLSFYPPVDYQPAHEARTVTKKCIFMISLNIVKIIQEFLENFMHLIMISTSRPLKY